MNEQIDLVARLNKIEDEIAKIHNDIKGLDKSSENITGLVDEYQGRLQKSLTDLSSHFVDSISPMVKKIVMDELKKHNGSRP